jgi:protein-L-isoaspartate O-methyltransferase
MLVRSGSAAQVYYRTFSSAGIVGAMIDTLREGMVAIDIGAHIGEYSMVAARLVGARGQVYAFEPQGSLAEVIRWNAAQNNLRNVSVWDQAVADHAGQVQFVADRRSMGGWIAQLPEDDDGAKHDAGRLCCAS